MSVSKLFNFSNLLTENTFDLVRSVNEKEYLSEGLSVMREFDESVQANTRKLYDSLLEAESTKKENICFGQFFADYKSTLNKFTSQMKELSGRFAINIETFVDANQSMLDKCCCCDPSTTYRGVQFTNLLNTDIPNIDPYKAFKKEWALLGRLLQDLDPSAPDEEKTKIVTSVYNSLSKEINDGWLNKCVQKIADCDDCGKDNFARVIFTKFIPGGDVDVTLDTPTIEQAKLTLRNYTDYISCIEKSADNFCDGLNKIACELGSMLFRNMDKKIDIKTDEDGVADASYRVNDYTMAQLNLFINTKISQIRELSNLYIIAVSIKMDCIYKYFKQCVGIIETACCSSNKTAAPDTTSAPVLPDGSNSNSPVAVDDDEDEDEVIDNPEDEPDGIEPNTPVADENESDDEPIDASSEEEDEEEEPAEESYLTKLDEEAYLFEADLALMNRYFLYNDLHAEYIKEDSFESHPTPDNVKPADDSGSGDAASSTDTTTSTEPASSGLSPQEEAGNRGKGLIQKIKDLVNSAKDSKNGTFATQIKFVQDNKAKILSTPIPSNWTIQNYNLSGLGSLQITPLNFNEKDLYKDKNKFLKSKYGKFGSETKGNVIDFFLAKMYSDKEVKYTEKDRAAGFKYIASEYDALYKHGMDLGAKLSDIYNKEYDIMCKAKAKEGKTATKESTMNYYFNEDYTGINEAADMDWKTRWSIVNDWFNVQYPVLVAYFNLISRNFKKQYAFLKKLESIKTK